MNYPKISIVTPSLNNGFSIEKTIISVINQNYPNLEYIIVDCGSTDNSIEIIKKYEKHLTEWIIEPFLTLSEAINKGLEKCTGDIFNWLNINDVMLPGSLFEISTSYRLFNFNVLCGYVNFVNRITSQIENLCRTKLYKNPELAVIDFSNCQAGTFYKLSIINEFGGINNSLHYSIDTELWIKYISQFGFAHVFTIDKVLSESRLIYSLAINKHLKLLKNEEESILNHLISLLDLPYWIKNRFKINTNSNEFKNWNVKALNVKRLTYYFSKKLFFSFYNNGNYFYAKKSLKQIIKKFDFKFIYVNRYFIFSLLLVYNNFFLSNIKNNKFEYLTSIAKRVLTWLEFRHHYNSFFKKNKMKHVLFVQPAFVSGGSEIVTLNYCNVLAKENYLCSIIGTNNSNNEWLDKFQTTFNNVIDISKTKYKNELLLKLILKIDPEYIFLCHTGYEILPELKRLNKSIKIVDIFHTTYGFDEEYMCRWVSFIDKRIVISRFLIGLLHDIYNKYNLHLVNRITYIPNTVDLEKFSPFQKTNYLNRIFFIPDESFIITFIGRLSKEKCPEKIIEIAKEILKRKENIYFTIWGDGPMSDEVEELIVQNNLENHVFLGGLTNDVSEILNDSNCLILTSEIEGLPVIILEAMAMGKVVLSTHVGAIDEIIENKVDGILIQYDDRMVNNFVENIILLENNKTIYNKIAMEARIKIEHFFSKDLYKNDMIKCFIE